MNNHQSIKDKLLRKANELTEREIAATLAVLCQYHNDITIIRDKNYLLRRLQQTHLDQQQLLVLLNDIKSVLIPEENIDWITKDLRASLWLYNYYPNHLASKIAFCNNSVNNHVDYLVTGIDCFFMPLNPPIYSNDNEEIHLINFYNFGLEHKLKIINDTKMLYRSILTERKYTDWIDINDRDQLYWASDYLRKAGMLVENKLFLAQNSEEIFTQICASLDSIDNFHNMSYQYAPTANKKYFISNMRKAWSQKKFRDKKDIEAAQDLLLTGKAKKQLLELSNAYGTSSVEILTDLIDTAYQNAKINALR